MRPEDRYIEKLEVREQNKNPNMQYAVQIEDARMQKVAAERRNKGEELRRTSKVNTVDPSKIRWEDAAADGADMTEGVAYSYMTDDNPHRYLFGVDLASATAAPVTSDVDLIGASDESDFGDDVLNTMAQIPHGVVAGLRNIVRTVRDSDFVDSMPLDVATKSRMEKFGIDPEQASEEERKAFRRYVSEERLSRLPFPEPNNTVAEFVKPISQFIFYAAPVTRAFQAMGATPLVADVAGGAAVSSVIWDRGEPELANLLVQFDQPEFTRSVLEYLAVDPDNDTDAELRVKRAMNDVLMNFAGRGLTTAFVKSLKMLRGVNKSAMKTEVEGYLELSAMRRRGEIQAFGKPPGKEEIAAWSKIIAGKIHKGLNKTEYKLMGSKHFDDATLDTIWEQAEAALKGEK